MAQEQQSSRTRKALTSALFTVFLDAIGVAILIPIYIALILPGPYSVLPPYWDIRGGYIMVGWLSGIYSICTFLSAPILGQLSDRYGRKPVLGISLVGTAIGYMLFAKGILDKNITMLFISRMIDGLTGGNIAIGRAIIGDVSTKENRTRNFGLVGSMFGLGFVLGPYIGGRLSAPNTAIINIMGLTVGHTPNWFNPTTPFWFAAILAFINSLLAFFVLPETFTQKTRGKLNWTKSLSDIRKAVTMPGIKRIMPVSFLFSAGFTFFTTFFGFTMINNIPDFKPSNVADYFSLIGIWIAVFQIVLIPILSKRFKNYQVLRFSIPGVALSVLLLRFVHSSTAAILVSPIVPLFVALTMANTIALISSMVSKEIQGEVMGLNSSVEAVAQGIPAILSGYIASIAVWLPNTVSATIITIAAILFIFLYKPNKVTLS